MFDVFFLAGVFITAIYGAHWLLEKWGIRVTSRYTDPSGILVLFLFLLILLAFGVVGGIIRSIFS